MLTFFYYVLGLIVGLITLSFGMSIIIPKPRRIYAVMKLDQLHEIISNVEGKIVYHDRSNNEHRKWDLIDRGNRKRRWLNIYIFFPWPFYKIYNYPITYTRLKKEVDVKDNEKIIEGSKFGSDVVVSKSGTSNHLRYREEYPSVVFNLETKGLGSVNVSSTEVIEIENGALAYFAIENWLRTVTDILTEAKRTIISEYNIQEINELSQHHDRWNTRMKELTRENLKALGVKLFESIYKDYEPANEETRELMNSYIEVTKAEQVGKARIITEENEATAQIKKAIGQAEAYEINQKKIVEWKKKYLIETGLAKVDDKGNIIELLPDANVRVGAEALKQLSELKGTLVLDSESITKMLNINPKTEKE